MGFETTVEIDTSSTKTHSTSTELSYRTTGSIAVPKNGNITVEFTIDWVENIDVPFTFATSLTGVSKENRKPLDRAPLEVYSNAIGFPSQNCKNQNSTNAVKVTLDSVMSSSTGVNTHIHAKKIPKKK